MNKTAYHGMQNHPMVGKLYTEYYVVCAGCQTEEPVGTRYRAVAVTYLKKQGWKQPRQGWTCKECWNKRGK